jgi:methionyl-tRNA formyltransferase
MDVKKEKLNVVFFGTPAFVTPVLEALIVNKDIEVVAVVTQPDRPVGRGRELTPSPVKRLAEIHGIKVLTPESFPTSGTASTPSAASTPGVRGYEPPGLTVAGIKFDLAVVAAYGLIIPKQVLEIPKYGFINVHPSLLPKYRGASPVAGAILAGEEKTGVTIIKMTEKVDAGPIIDQWDEKIESDDNAHVLRFRLFNKAAGRLPKIIKDYANPGGSGTRTPGVGLKTQDESKATYTKKLKKEHGFFPWEAVRAAMKDENYDIGKLKLVEAFPFLKDNFILRAKRCEVEKPKRGKTDEFSTGLPAQAGSNSKYKIAPLLERAIRAFYPWPGVHTKCKVQSAKCKVKEMRLKLLRGHLEPLRIKPTRHSGPDPESRKMLNQVQHDGGGEIDRLVPDQVQLEGKKPVSWQQFLQGYPEVAKGLA